MDQTLALGRRRRSAARSRSSACRTARLRRRSAVPGWRRPPPAPTADRAAATARRPPSPCSRAPAPRPARARCRARPRSRAPRPVPSRLLFTAAVVCTRLSTQSRVGDRRGSSRLTSSCVRAASILQVAQQRLRDVERQARPEQRVVAVQEAVALGVRRVPAEAVRRAEPGQPLAERRRSTMTTSVRVAVGIRKLAGGWSWLLRCTLVLNIGRNAPDGGRDPRVADLRIEPRPP